MTRGGRICFFNSFRRSRLAACLSRRLWTNTSSTIPVWSTARQSQCFTPAIFYLVEVPFVANAGQPALDLIGKCLAELERPLPHGLVADDDAAGRQHLFHHAQAQRKAEVQPHGVADDLARKAVAGVGRVGCGCHAGHLPVPTFSAKPRPKLTVPQALGNRTSDPPKAEDPDTAFAQGG